MGCGSRLCSDYFEVCGQLFRLEVYPGGFTADTRRFVSVFLTTPGALNPNHIMYELAILDQVRTMFCWGVHVLQLGLQSLAGFRCATTMLYPAQSCAVCRAARTATLWKNAAQAVAVTLAAGHVTCMAPCLHTAVA